MTSDIDVNHSPLPGYRLTQRLGAGGYGEVWRAEAPGGLTKAIKFVFGQQHEKRATRELRALELIKQMRHPFLLSLERIEIVEGRLLIVTELADGSVKDRFDECRHQNMPGIPREELLRYLRDAADALDYMAESHGLQHLDIKPENLLLLASHVKVADFGLVKDMKQSEASLVGGMTPLYAAPEVFRGQPSRQSDQYSLAIVYQEMLSGALAFAGGNAAELTLQHLNDEPDLSSLSGADSYVVSRALAKDPGHRYATCREFVEALQNVPAESAPYAVSESSQAVGQHAPWPSDTRSHPGTPTELFDDDDTVDAVRESLLMELPPMAPRVTDLPPVEVNAGEFQAAPTLFLGIGGAAGRVLHHLRQGIREQYGNQPLPAVQMLLIDTDPKTLAEAARGEHGLTNEEILSVPLRRPQHYRERWDQLLCWLSRRWLYNIPKSMRTEGLRPLGRLALVDHARQTCQRIRRALSLAMDQESVAAAGKATGRAFRRDTARVYVVASISGGTGSGMVLDVAYAMRTMLAKMNLPHVTVFGILLHSTGRDPRHCELARVNAYSWLTEFQHFHQPEWPYPGDASCGLPAHQPGVTAFDHTYLVHLGEGAEESEFDHSAQMVADYLRLDALSPAQVALDACRRTSADAGAAGKGDARINLRSFGLFRRTATPSGFCDEAATSIGAQLLNNWRNAGRSALGLLDDFNENQGFAAGLIQRIKWTSAGLTAHARSLVDARLGSDTATFLTKWFTQRLPANSSSDAVQFKAVDDVFGGIWQRGEAGGQPSLLGDSLATIVEPICAGTRSEVRQSILHLLDEPGQWLAGAESAAHQLQHHFESVLTDTSRLGTTLADRLREVRQPPPSGAAQQPPRANQYFELRLDQLALCAAEYVSRLVLLDLKAIADDLTSFGRELAQMASAFRSHNEIGEPDSDPSGFAAKIHARLDEFTAEVNARLQSEYLAQQGGLFQTVMQGGRPRAQLCSKLQEFARQSVQRGLAGLVASGTTDNASSEAGGLKSELASATPALLEHGGARRVLAIVPDTSASASERQRLATSVGVPVSVVAAGTDGMTLCVEAERLPLAHIAIQFVQRRRDSVEFAKRVHTRSDVSWMPLVPTSNKVAVQRLAAARPVVVTVDCALRQTEVV